MVECVGMNRGLVESGALQPMAATPSCKSEHELQ
jgi:hypothetical protein